MKNYYEILEVDVKASKEIIDKAFKVLAKKYHPDSHDETKKEWAENKFKELNEAYEILSDDEKRKDYDIELDYAKNAELQALQIKNAELELLVASLKSEIKTLTDNQNNYLNIQKQLYTQPTNSYYNTTNTTKTTNPYFEKIKYYNKVNSTKGFFKNIIALIITLLLIIVLAYIIWQIPFTKNMLINLYNNNAPIKNFVNFFLNK